MKDKALRDAREEQQELEALHRLDEECVHQQRAGNYLKAFDCMERALVLRRHFFGIESEEVIQACRALAEMCNLLAMSFLQQDNYAVTIDLLKKAEVLTQRHHPAERATTLNNLACYYRRLGKLHSAMTSLKRALEVEKRLENVRNAADTQLNMCAVLSQLGKHQEALEHAQEALITLQEGFIQGKHTTETGSDSPDTSSSRLDRISVMCIAYHNVGVEQEFLKDYAESVASYKKGIGLAEQYLGENHSITTTIRNSYLAAKRTLATKARVRPCSATRGQKSPTKAGSRLLLSPRSGSLRSPSPLAKDRSGHQIPTPRSIIADALSRAPISALPPLEIQSPPSAGTKKKKKTEIHDPKTEARGLSPTDPFFSPRFRFEDGSTDTKAKKLASISPRSSVATHAEVQTLASGKGKRERRKSSIKKPPTTAESGARTRKGSAGERTNTAPASQPDEGDIIVGVVESQGESTDDKADPSKSPTTDETIPLPATAQVALFENVADRTTEDDATKPQNTITRQHGLAIQNGGGTADSEVDPVEGAISIVLTKVIDKIVKLGNETCSPEGHIDPEQDNAIVSVISLQEESTNDVPSHDHNFETGNAESSAELDVSYAISESMEVEHHDEMRESSNSDDDPVSLHANTEDILYDELLGVPDSANDEFEGEHTDQLEADRAVESDLTEASSVLQDPIEETHGLVDESLADDTEPNVELPDMSLTDDTSQFENTEIHAVDEVSPEVRLETPSDGDVVFGATAGTDELCPTDGEEGGDIVAGSNANYNAEPEHDFPIEILPEISDEQVGSIEGEQVVPTGDVDEQDVGQEVEATGEADEQDFNQEVESTGNVDEPTVGQEVDVPHFTDEAEDEINADLEPPEHDMAEVNVNQEHYASVEQTTGEYEAHQDGVETVHREDERIEAYDTPGLDYVDQGEQEPLNYELQDPGSVGAPYSSDPQQDWSHAEQMQYPGADDAEFYQEHSTLSPEEHAIEHENVAPSEHYDYQTQRDDHAAALTNAPDPGKGVTVDVDTDAQEPPTPV